MVRRIAIASAVGLVLIVSQAGCGSDATAPNVVGKTAEQADQQLEKAGLTSSYAQEPTDKTRCTVSAQDKTGSVAKGATIGLTCQVQIPDLTGRQADLAQSDVQQAGAQATFASEPVDAGRCQVKRQDKIGPAPPGTEFTLDLKCKAAPPPPPPPTTPTQSTSTATQPPPQTTNTAPPTTTQDNCDPNYSGACLDPNASDYDCAGGSGNGPKYVQGPIQVVGTDHYGLDANGDGVACQ